MECSLSGNMLGNLTLRISPIRDSLEVYNSIVDYNHHIRRKDNYIWDVTEVLANATVGVIYHITHINISKQIHCTLVLQCCKNYISIFLKKEYRT